MVTIKWPVWRASASAEFVKETLIYSNQRESILLILLVLRCFLAPPLRGGALVSVSLTLLYKCEITKNAMGLDSLLLQRIRKPENRHGLFDGYDPKKG